METLNVRVAVWPAVSNTDTPKLNWPGAVGVPLRMPFAASVRPGGRYVNGTRVHVSAPVPPVVVNVFVYAVPTFPVASGELPLIEIVVTFIVNCFAPKLAALPESAAFTRNWYTPETVGVPARSPLGERLIPDGSDPLTRDHVNDAAQHAESCLENADPAIGPPRS